MARARPETNPGATWGIFGGTFNPIHHGHLITARYVVENYPLEHLLFVPSGNPPHRPNPEVSPDARYTLVEKAIKDHPSFEIDPIEIDREGPCYTIDTVRTLQDRTPERNYVLILGTDELISFTEWHQWQDLLERVRLIGLTRPGFSRDEIPPEVLDRTTFFNTPRIEISSSGIRKRVQNQRPIRYLTPDPVIELIHEWELYLE